jgi:phospholipid/cholesterol/gamma-HCH transport system substrate-binding protein
VRKPNQTGPAQVNTSARCSLPPNSPTDIRGAQHAPGGDPISTGGGGTVYPRSVPASGTGAGVQSMRTVQVGGSMGSSGVLGDNSWLPLLTGGLS